jgi:hypothetical protein
MRALKTCCQLGEVLGSGPTKGATDAFKRARSFNILLAGLLLITGSGFAHCDGMDGPVVQAAQKALAAQDVDLVLIWVPRDDEAEVRQVFARTLAVRKLGSEAREVADRYFFETLVRLHRAAEGAPFTGLQPTGRDLGPAIPAADKALDASAIGDLDKLLSETTRAGLRKHFQNALAAKDFHSGDLAAGREYVKAYVEFVHYVERTYAAATLSPHGHFRESWEGAAQTETGAGHGSPSPATDDRQVPQNKE